MQNFLSVVFTANILCMQNIIFLRIAFNLQAIIFSFSFVCCPDSVLSSIVKCDGHGLVILFCSSWFGVLVVLCSCILLTSSK